MYNRTQPKQHTKPVPHAASALGMMSNVFGAISLVPLYDAMLLAAIPAIVIGMIALQKRVSSGPNSRAVVTDHARAARGIRFGMISVGIVVIYWSALWFFGTNFSGRTAQVGDYFAVTLSLFGRH
jgi:hypothetical protein